MLRPTLKEPSVNDSEQILAKLATRTFFSLWSYPSLFRSVGKGKELIDLTVYFNNTLILFSDKGQVKFQEHNPTDLAWRRWYREAIQGSAIQLYGAEKFVRTRPDQIFLNSKLQDPFPFDLSSTDLKIHLVAVTRGIGDAARKYYAKYGEGSSKSLACAFDLPDSVLLETPFFLGGSTPGRTFIHYLEESGLELLLEELCTPSDFIDYLESKEEAVAKRGLKVSLGEEETLAYYLLGDGKLGFGQILRPDIANGHPFAIPEGHWLDFRGSVLYALRYSRKKNARRWGELVARFSDSVIEANAGEGAHLPLLNHAQCIEVLASENVYSSGMLAELLFEKFSEVPEFGRSARLAPSLMKPERLYLFVFFPWDEDYKSYEEYRDERLICMTLYALVARYKFPRFEELLVLGAATRGTPASETIFVVDNTVPLTAEERVSAQKIMKEEDILNDTSERRVASNNSTGVGRNDSCPCGSMKKFKKCCYRTGY